MMIEFLKTHWTHVALACSALYTLAGLAWTIRAERLLRQLRTEQKVQAWTYEDLRRDVDDVQAFLENGNTLRQIPVIPLRKKVPQ